MTKNRASIFDTDEIDVSEFAPNRNPPGDALPAEKVRAIAEASNFLSREPRLYQAAPPPTPRRAARRLRTGRTEQLNARATAQTLEDFYAIADQQGWKAAETLERAVAALKRELGGQGRV